MQSVDDNHYITDTVWLLFNDISNLAGDLMPNIVSFVYMICIKEL